MFVPDDLGAITANGPCAPVCMQRCIFSGCAAAACDGLPAGTSATPIAAEWLRDGGFSVAHMWLMHDGREILIVFDAGLPELSRHEMGLSGTAFVAHGLFLAGKLSPLTWDEGGELSAVVLWVHRR